MTFLGLRPAEQRGFEDKRWEEEILADLLGGLREGKPLDLSSQLRQCSDDQLRSSHNTKPSRR